MKRKKKWFMWMSPPKKTHNKHKNATFIIFILLNIMVQKTNQKLLLKTSPTRWIGPTPSHSLLGIQNWNHIRQQALMYTFAFPDEHE